MSNKPTIHPTSDQNKARGSDHLTGENAQGVAAIVRDKGEGEITSALNYELMTKASNISGVNRIGGDAFVQEQRTPSQDPSQTLDF